MNNYKSQGQTFEQVRVDLDEGIFIEDPFFKQHLENIRKHPMIFKVMARANAEIEASLNGLITRTGIKALGMKPLELEDKG
ncbi:hypothetical protein CB7_97 [Pectobacterium phage vB_PatM_CB7]|nr:hypothetical protein CB7_97 [Pectobacterium phage vB_PatM_CB7]